MMPRKWHLHSVEANVEVLFVSRAPLAIHAMVQERNAVLYPAVIPQKNSSVINRTNTRREVVLKACDGVSKYADSVVVVEKCCYDSLSVLWFSW